MRVASDSSLVFTLEGSYHWGPHGLYPGSKLILQEHKLHVCYEGRPILNVMTQVRLPPCLLFYFLDLGCKGLTPPTPIPFAWWNNKPNLKHEPDLSYKVISPAINGPMSEFPFKMVPSMSNFTFSKRKGGQIFYSSYRKCKTSTT